MLPECLLVLMLFITTACSFTSLSLSVSSIIFLYQSQLGVLCALLTSFPSQYSQPLSQSGLASEL